MSITIAVRNMLTNKVIETVIITTATVEREFEDLSPA